MSVIANVELAEFVVMQVDDHVTMKLILHLRHFQKSLQKIFRYFFNGRAVSTSFVLLKAGDFSVIFILDLNDSELTVALLANLCNIAYIFQIFSNNYH